MGKSNRTDYEVAFEALRDYFDITAEADLFDIIAEGSNPTELRQKKLKGILEGTNPSSGDVLGYLFQGTQYAYFASEMVDILNEFAKPPEPPPGAKADPEEVKRLEKIKENLEGTINVICEHSKGVHFGKNLSPEFGKANPAWPKGSAELQCDLSKYTCPIQFALPEGEKNLKFNPTLIKKINENPKVPGKDRKKDEPTLAAIIVNSPISLPTNRQPGGAALFVGHIPTLEMTRCVPHLEISINSPEPRLVSNVINGISFGRFLMGNADIGEFEGIGFFESAVDNRLRPNYIATSSKANRGEIANNFDFTDTRQSSVGMEAFTSPQTMVMGDEDHTRFSASRAASVLDRFRPFLSIRDFKVDLVSNVGLIQTKTANMTIVLHDRSRLSEISELVKIDMYGDTEICVEYGWNHPDPFNDQNPWGRFINSLKVMEKYQVVTSTYSFDEVGQVTISLKLSLKGNSDTAMLKVGGYELTASQTEAINELVKLVKTFKKAFPDFPEQEYTFRPRSPKGRGARKSVTIFKFNVGDYSDANSILGIPEAKLKEIRKWVRNNVHKGFGAKGKGGADKEEIVKQFDEFFGKAGFKKKGKTVIDGHGGIISEIRSSIAMKIKTKILSIRTATQLSMLDQVPAGEDNSKNVISEKQLKKLQANMGLAGLKSEGAVLHDPFFHKTLQGGKQSRAALYNSITNISRVSNFGTLFMNFCARALAASRKFDEVQVVFYTFNHYASFMRDLPISSFPIDLSDFEAAFAEESRLGSSMFLQDFISFMNAKFTGNPAYRYGYGFGHLYENDDGEVKTIKKYEEDSSGLEDQRQKILRSAYGVDGKAMVEAIKKDSNKVLDGPDLKFVQPRIAVNFECLPSKTSESHTILRISIFDRAESQNELLSELMRSTEEDNFEAITRTFNQKPKSVKAESRKKHFTKLIQELVDKKIVKVIEPEAGSPDTQIRYVCQSTPDQVKLLCKQRMATIEYGTATTNVMSANISTSAPSGLFEVNVTRANLGHGRTALGARTANMPVEVAPVQLSMQTMGFPFFYIGQEFFIDFQTGTTIDNIYRVVSVSHQLSEGSFNTNIKFTPGYAYGKFKTVENIMGSAKRAIKNSEETT